MWLLFCGGYIVISFLRPKECINFEEYYWTSGFWYPSSRMLGNRRVVPTGGTDRGQMCQCRLVLGNGIDKLCIPVPPNNHVLGTRQRFWDLDNRHELILATTWRAPVNREPEDFVCSPILIRLGRNNDSFWHSSVRGLRFAAGRSGSPSFKYTSSFKTSNLVPKAWGIYWPDTKFRQDFCLHCLVHSCF